MKRLISWALSLALILSMVPAIGFAVSAAEYTVVDKVPATIDTSVSFNPWSAPENAWGVMYPTSDGQPTVGGTWDAWSDNHYGEIVAEGYQDAGALHLVSAPGNNAGVTFGANLVSGTTYTLGLWAKGTSNSSVPLRSYANGDTIIIDASQGLSTDWKYYQVDIVANNGTFMLFAPDWGNTDIYVDNVTLTDANGTDMLRGYGAFCVNEEVTKDTETAKQWLNEALFNSTKNSSAYAAETGVWTPMYPSGSPEEGTWAAWDDTHYAELSLNGYKDAGSLHLVSCGGKNTGLAINAGMTAGQTYTLGFYAKGTVNTGRVMGMYANGDGTIIGATETFGAGWNYYEHTFTAALQQINIVAADWGSVDIYVDNITLKNSEGVDLLAGYGDFYTSVDPSLTAVPVTLDTAKLNNRDNAPSDEWVPFAPTANYQDTWPAWEAGVNYGEIVAEGYKDVGALHLVSAGGKNTGVVINPGLVSGQTYTVGMWVKGSATSNKMLAVYGNGDPCLIGNPAYCGDVCLESVPADWTYIEKSITANGNSLAIFAADWGVTDIYIDNITVKDSAGVDLLAGYGDFYTYADLTREVISFDPSAMTGAYSCPNGQWVPMFPQGTPDEGTWGAWSADSHYAEIVKDGHNDLGALHMVSNVGKNVGVAFNAGMTAGETYTLGLWAKGTSNSGGVMISYGNGDFSIINTAQDLGADWTYYEVSFTAQMSQINFCVRDWGVTDLYMDNVTLKNSEGIDLLAGYGDFWQEVKPDEPEPDGPNVPTDDVVSGTPDVLKTNKHSWERLSHVDAWTPFFPVGVNAETNWTAWENKSENETGYNYAEIAAIGKSDAGSLHFVRGDVYEHVGVAIEAGMVPGETYTLKAYVKGYAKTTWNGLRLYGNGDALIASFGAGGTVANNANWTEVSVTFTANRSTLELMVGADCYVCDIYVDDLQLINSKGVNILGNKGNFSVIEEDIPDLAVISPSLERTYRWYWDANGLGGVYLTPSVNNNVEIIADGCKDPGALNIWQNKTVQDTLLTLATTQAKDLTNNQTYTLSMNVKGVFGNSGTCCTVYPAYLNQEQAQELMNIPTLVREALGIPLTDANKWETLIVPEWVNIQVELPYNGGGNGFTYLNLMVSQYTWGSHFYIDNIQVLDPDGNDVLGGSGNFMDSGSESYPIRLANNDTQIMNSNTMYYMANINSGTLSVSNHVESGITAGDQNFSVTCNRTTQSASNKNVTMNVASAKDGMPVIFSITSTAGSVDMPGSKLEMIQNAGKYNLYDISVTNVGTEPETLTMGQQELGFVWGDSDGYTYTYTPAKKGTLNVAVESGDVNVILSTADSNGSGSLDVDAGETVTVQVIPARNANGGYIATDAVITSSFTEYVCHHEHTETVVVDPTLDKAGSSTVVCSDCGETLSVTELPPLTKVTWNLTLADALSVNFCITVDESIRSSTTVTVNFNGEDTVYNAAELPEKITVKAAAAQMNDTITVTIANGGDTVTKTYTVKQYADTILEGSYTEATKQMVQAMLNYGGAAQTYFGHNTENSVSSELGTEAVPETTTDKSVSGAADGISFYSASLVFRNRIAVRFYFTGSTEGITFKVGEKEYSAVAKDGMSYVEIADILPQDLDQQITLTVTDASGNVLTVVYGPMNYIVRMNSKGSENLQNLLKALYNYHLAAKAYTAV